MQLQPIPIGFHLSSQRSACPSCSSIPEGVRWPLAELVTRTDVYAPLLQQQLSSIKPLISCDGGGLQ